jgi:hydroxymethylpyrimidine pyrophosphatase-like HAD family hydrolase
MAHALGLPHPLVCNSGALVKDMATEATLWRADLDPSTFRRVLDVFASENRPAVCFTDRRLSEPDFVIERYPTHHIDFDDYVRVNLAHVEVQQGWPAQVISRSIPAFHLCAIGTRSEMLDFERSVLTLGAGVRTFVQRSPRYVGWMCEIVRHDAGKWNALAALAQRWKIAEAEICAVGDDMNDLCMIRNAGLGVAMPHAPDDVRAAAHHVLDSDRPEALATFLRTLC